MLNDMKLTILQDAPCEHCSGACCKNSYPGEHPFAALLHLDEHEQFVDAAVDYEGEKVIPYVNDQCVFLTDENKCGVYDNRPKVCKEFSCLSSWMTKERGHGFFLEDHPEVVDIIEKNCKFEKDKS